MGNSQSPKKAIISLMTGTVPERNNEILEMWDHYNPKVTIVQDAKYITLNATKDRIQFDFKTMEVFWLIGFSGWRAIECYSPHVLLSTATEQTIDKLVQNDQELADVELAYRERRAAAQTLIDVADPSSAPWPPELPRPSSNRDAFSDLQFKAAFDLTYLAVAFTLFHEFRHVMLDHDDLRPLDLREEELACDVWAREFMTAKLAAYAQVPGQEYRKVLRKRSMGFALAALILHEITPIWGHGGSAGYFSIATRLQALLNNTPLPDDDYFWVFVSSLLIGIFRQKQTEIKAPILAPKELAKFLVSKL